MEVNFHICHYQRSTAGVRQTEESSASAHRKEVKMANQFGKLSRISVCAAVKDGHTILEDVSFTAPYKIMRPFSIENGGIQIMPLTASAGIMAGDTQEFDYHVREGAMLEVLSQSFEKIHKMDEGSASRRIEAVVEPGGTLSYFPQPVIPFAGSAFESRMTIHLADETARLFLLDILSCGRAVRQERFLYRSFSSKVLIYRGDRLIYRDNTRYEPSHMPMEGIGMYEGYTHLANIFLTAQKENSCTERIQEEIQEILEKDPEYDGGVTRLSSGDLAVKIFGRRAQKLQQAAEEIKKLAFGQK